MKKFMKEFKDFATKGNVIDMAVGIIIGGAFKAIVTSLVNDLIMPLVGMALGGVSFVDLKIIITEAVGETPEVAIRYGAFIQSFIDFLIIALVIFVMIKGFTTMKKKEEEKPAAPPAPAEDVVLLTEIRDLLKK